MCLLFMLMIIVPTIELYLLMEIGQKIGTLNTVALIILTGTAGSTLMKMEGWRAWQNMKKELSEGRLPGKRIMDGFLILVGGIFLITPGVLTDILGLLLIFPLTRIFFREILIKILKNKVKFHSNIITIYPEEAMQNNSNVITIYPETPKTNNDNSQENRRISEKTSHDERRN